jgi:hypothetical protein
MDDAVIDVDGAVMQYQATVRRYKTAIEGLSTLSRSLEIQMRKMDAVMRPIVLANGISKVPDEVLARIFECIYEPWPEYPYRNTTPGELRKVCKRFKRVADSQLSLMRDFSSKMPIGWIKAHLNQQTQLGLRVGIDERNTYNSNIIPAFAKRLAPHAHRWEELRFFHSGSTSEIKQTYRKFMSLDLPRLERLTLWSRDWKAADKIYSTWTVPKLRRVVLNVDNDGMPMELPGKSNILECDLVVTGSGLI